MVSYVDEDVRNRARSKFACSSDKKDFSQVELEGAAHGIGSGQTPCKQRIHAHVSALSPLMACCLVCRSNGQFDIKETKDERA